MIVAFLMSASRVWMRPSTNACSFLASSYSAFSERSPCSLASWIRLATSGRLTVTISSSSARSFSRPSLERYVGLLFIADGPPLVQVVGWGVAARVGQVITKRTPGVSAAVPARLKFPAGCEW